MTTSTLPFYRTDRFARQARLGVMGAALIGAILVGALYNGYRYPLQINSTGTSPTYADTPMTFIMGKYLLMAALTYVAALCAPFELRGPLVFSARQGLLLYTIAWLLTIASIHAIQSGSLNTVQLVAPVVCVLPLVVLVGSWLAARTSMRDIARIVLLLAIGLLLLHAISDLGQIAMYQLLGRLPALGYAGSVVRFGGFWDDPNSASAYSASMITFLLSGRVPMPRKYQVGLIICGLFVMAFSWSYSGAVVLVSGVTILVLLQLRQRLSFAAISLALVILGAFTLSNARPDFSGIPVIGPGVEAKFAGSIEARLRTITGGYYGSLVPDSPLEWLVGSNVPGIAETAALSWLAGVGLSGLGLTGIWVYASLRAVAEAPDRDWLFAVSGGLIAGSVFVPYMTIFPMGTFFFMLIGATAAYYDGQAQRISQQLRSGIRYADQRAM